ncbi:MAG: glycosyltransferase [Gordonia sp. (in: high G+C Gram-positive bacteria)]
MADVLIAAYGSRGDIMPLTDIGCRLRAVGHRVVLTTNTDLVEDVQACGLDARAIDFEMDAEIDQENTDPAKLALQMVKPAGMRQLSRNLLAAVADVPADIVLLTPFAELAGHPLAEARSIPSLGLRFQPISATGDFPPTLLGAWSAGARINRAAGRLAERGFDRIYLRVVADLRADLRLPRCGARALRRRRTAEEWPILHGFSPSVVARPQDWRPGLDVVGYWWSQHAESWSPPAELVEFLEAGTPPVFVGLGSLMVSAEEAKRLSAVIHAALEMAGVRGIVQSGGAGLAVPAGDALMTIGPVPYDWLFPRVAAAVHSCGAGTVAASLRAGLPIVGVPSPGGDQPFWAHRVQHLGVGPAPLPRPTLDAERLGAAIAAVVTDPRFRDAARRLSRRIAADDGVGRVVTEVERLLE